MNKIKLDKIQTYIIKEFSSNYENLVSDNQVHLIELGQVPILINHAGVYFRRLFNDDDYFHKVKTEHEFQELTESTKESKLFRKGIYLTEILKEETNDDNEILHFRLLRCSSNFTGPTDNIRTTDHKVLNILNDAAKYVFEKETKLNHVLVQIYENLKKEIKKKLSLKLKLIQIKRKICLKTGLLPFALSMTCLKLII